MVKLQDSMSILVFAWDANEANSWPKPSNGEFFWTEIILSFTFILFHT